MEAPSLSKCSARVCTPGRLQMSDGQTGYVSIGKDVIVGESGLWESPPTVLQAPVSIAVSASGRTDVSPCPRAAATHRRSEASPRVHWPGNLIAGGRDYLSSCFRLLGRILCPCQPTPVRRLFVRVVESSPHPYTWIKPWLRTVQGKSCYFRRMSASH